MDKKLLEEIKKKLLAKKQEIIENFEREHSSEISEIESENVIGDIVDEANSVYELQIFNKLSEKEQNELIEIEEALARIAEGVYGKCVSCGNEIDPKRLLAIPQTKKCIKCKQLEERNKIRLG